jgi:hypothetical protein
MGRARRSLPPTRGPCAEGNGGEEEAELPGAGFSSSPSLLAPVSENRVQLL